MIKCSKCNGVPSENDEMGWKCNSCGKTFKTTKTQLYNILMKKKENPEQTFLKCPSCKISLDDGNESITWKCACGTINMGKLKDFEEEVENYPESNLIKCPECGKEIKDTETSCPECGYPLIEHEKKKDANNKSRIDGLRSMRTMVIILAVICFIVSGVFFSKGHNVKNEYYNSDYSLLNKNAYVGGDAYNYIINGTYFTGYSVIASAFFLGGLILFSNSMLITIKMREYGVVGG